MPANHDLMTSSVFAEYSPHTIPDSDLTLWSNSTTDQHLLISSNKTYSSSSGERIKLYYSSIPGIIRATELKFQN